MNGDLRELGKALAGIKGEPKLYQLSREDAYATSPDRKSLVQYDPETDQVIVILHCKCKSHSIAYRLMYRI